MTESRRHNQEWHLHEKHKVITNQRGIIGSNMIIITHDINDYVLISLELAIISQHNSYLSRDIRLAVESF